MAFDWGSLINTGIQVGAGLLGSKKNADNTAQAAASTRPVPYSTQSQFGTSTVNPTNNSIQFQGAANPFAQLFTMGGLTQGANAFSAPGAAYYGAPKEVVQAANGTMNTDADAAGRLQLLRDQAAPGANQQAVALRERLFGRGTLGSSGGGAEQEAFLNSQNQADLNRQMTAADWANQRAQQRFSNALGATGFGGQIQQQQFNQFAASQTGASNPFQQLLQQAGVGVGAAGGVAPGAAMANAQAQTAPWNIATQALSQFGPQIGQYFGNMISSSPKTSPQGYSQNQADPYYGYAV